MPKYASTWDAAKKKFENDTGMKKPSEMGKVFGVSYRKGTGIDSELETLDKLVPTSFTEVLSQKTLKAIGASHEKLVKSADDYTDLLDKSIKEEKEKLGGKEASAIYRDLKILKASLTAVVAEVKSDLARLQAMKTLETDKLSRATSNIVSSMRVLREAMERNAKAGLVKAQELLKNPTPEAFNAAFPKTAREITQALNQYQKWTMPEDLPKDILEIRNRQMEDEAIYKEVGKLYHEVSAYQERVKAMTVVAGDTPLDATLSKLANAPPTFAPTASREDVIAGIKHFVSLVKPVVELASDMQKGIVR